ncbi:hypothetical protein [Microcystis aeruginosa]|uniref:hypothetical protein n=1 Tax=Microcystis aeruginosa TaxID=1126 RepID=UPI0009B70902|nr:hypothetical protein [Microcystis aeruginosa]
MLEAKHTLCRYVQTKIKSVAVGHNVSMSTKNQPPKVAILLAIIVLIGTLGSALISKWPEIFPLPGLSCNDLQGIKITGVHISSKSQQNDAQAYLDEIRKKSPYSIPESPQLVPKTNNDDGTFPRKNISVRVFYKTDRCAADLVTGLSPSSQAIVAPHYDYENKPKQGTLEVRSPIL